MRRGRSEREIKERYSTSRAPSPWGKRFEDGDEHGDASPLLSLLPHFMFNHEPVDADPSPQMPRISLRDSPSPAMVLPSRSPYER